MKHKDFLEWIDGEAVLGLAAVDGVIACLYVDKSSWAGPNQWFEVDTYNTDRQRYARLAKYQRWLDKWQAKQEMTSAN